MRLPAFETQDFQGQGLSRDEVVAAAPALLVLLRGFA